MAEAEFSERAKHLIHLLKERMTETDTAQDFEVIAVPSIIPWDEEYDESPLLPYMIAFIEKNPTATIQEITEYMLSLLPPVEIVDDDEDEYDDDYYGEDDHIRGNVSA